MTIEMNKPLTELTSRELVELYNSLTAGPRITRFSDNESARRRIRPLLDRAVALNEVTATPPPPPKPSGPRGFVAVRALDTGTTVFHTHSQRRLVMDALLAAENKTMTVRALCELFQRDMRGVLIKMVATKHIEKIFD